MVSGGCGLVYKTTKKEFAQFKKTVKWWINYFGLKNWEVKIFHEYSEDARAFYNFDTCGMICRITLSTEWNYAPGPYGIKQSAFHEVCEILLAPIDDLGHNYFNRDFISEKKHDIIRRLENTIFIEHKNRC